MIPTRYIFSPHFHSLLSASDIVRLKLYNIFQNIIEPITVKLIFILIYFYTKKQTVYVDPETTTIERLWEIVSEKVLLTPASAECFFIWQISKDLEILLYADQTVDDAYL